MVRYQEMILGLSRSRHHVLDKVIILQRCLFFPSQFYLIVLTVERLSMLAALAATGLLPPDGQTVKDRGEQEAGNFSRPGPKIVYRKEIAKERVAKLDGTD